jgi:hypothetical protein
MCISNDCSNLSPVTVNGGNGPITPIILGGTLITGGGDTISLAPVPEPSVWAMFTIVLLVLFVTLRLRDKSLRPA